MEQIAFLLPVNNTKSNITTTNEVYCLFNGERGFHSYDEMRISRIQYEATLEIQTKAYAKQIRKTYGDFEVLSIAYDWGTHKQMWTVKCNKCGDISVKHDGYQWSRGKMYSRSCSKCKEREKEEKVKQKEESKRLREEQKAQVIAAEIGKEYGKFKVIGYKGYDKCKVKCTECGAERIKGVTISNLQKGEYPKCDCGKPNYSDSKWIGERRGHLTAKRHVEKNFICICDCGRERYCTDSYFARGRYLDCGDPKCEFINKARGRAIAARIRGHAYETVAEALLKSNGYKTRHVGKTGDYGVDIVAIDADGKKIAVQCKSNMKDTTSVSAVQEVYAGGRYYGLEHFAVISHSGYSMQAVKMAKKLGVYLSDGSTFVYPENMQKYVNDIIPTYNATKNVKAQKIYEMNGQKKTLANWAFEYGTTPYCVRKGLNRGLSLENALKYRPTKKKEYTVDGFVGTIDELYKHFKPDVSLERIRQRMREGKTIEEALFMGRQALGRPCKRS